MSTLWQDHELLLNYVGQGAVVVDVGKLTEKWRCTMSADWPLIPQKAPIQGFHISQPLRHSTQHTSSNNNQVPHRICP